MASNSFAMKNWAVGSVGVILAFLATANKLCYWWIVLVPWITFGCLDAYYLYLENCFRDYYNSQNKQYHLDKLNKSELNTVRPYFRWKNRWKAIFSYSVLPMYLLLFGLILSWLGNRFIVNNKEIKWKER
ncbi:MAG: hypothetical protein LBI63_01560 [Candidatus Ancillula sp.]|jgi:hypothetical protein|nr:hypothetical protein [Candidatus Ancillula sp.]